MLVVTAAFQVQHCKVCFVGVALALSTLATIETLLHVVTGVACLRLLACGMVLRLRLLPAARSLTGFLLVTRIATGAVGAEAMDSKSLQPLGVRLRLRLLLRVTRTLFLWPPDSLCVHCTLHSALCTLHSAPRGYISHCLRLQVARRQPELHCAAHTNCKSKALWCLRAARQDFAVIGRAARGERSAIDFGVSMSRRAPTNKLKNSTFHCATRSRALCAQQAARCVTLHSGCV